MYIHVCVYIYIYICLVIDVHIHTHQSHPITARRHGAASCSVAYVADRDRAD